MAQLKNPKHELFAQGIVAGLSGRKAYKEAGYIAEDAGADVAACRLLKRSKVIARIDELRTRTTEKVTTLTAISLKSVVDELSKIAFANMQDYVQITPEGDPYVDLSKLTREQAAAIGEIVVEDFKEGRGKDARDVRRVRFKLLDKKGALVDLGKHLGGFVTRAEVGKPGDFADATDADLIEIIARGQAITGTRRKGIARASEASAEEEVRGEPN